MIHDTITAAREATEAVPSEASDILDLLIAALADDLDHPELWSQIGRFAELLPELPDLCAERLELERGSRNGIALAIVGAMCQAGRGEVRAAVAAIEPLAVTNSQSPLVQGAIFHLHGLLDPENPKYDLKGMVCPEPFERLDVLERSTHQCCASWLHTSAGDLSKSEWQDVWNSDAAQDIRASIHDGSYRHCNKVACPRIHNGQLVRAEELAAQSPEWRDIVETQATEMPHGPRIVNLAYDRTCNLSCPSCRTEKFAADAEMRARFEDMQQTRILPMLKQAETVFITGSGDPFASKNFRRLMEQLGPDDYPDLRFRVMTNAMLFTRREWARFPALHRRVSLLRVSIDAATGPTHELLRRGARWDVLKENLAFAGELRRDGLVSNYQLVFVVQAENYREMGDACDLAERLGADEIFFSRMTNWGTFSDEEYRSKAVFLPTHPEHGAFLGVMADPRLQAAHVDLGDLHAFVGAPAE